MNACGGFATIAHSAHNKIRTADEIATGKHAGNTGHLIFVDDDAGPFIDLDFVGIARGEN
jgi:hypothetical protein